MTAIVSDAPVLTSEVAGVLVVTINRPEVRNAINTAAAEGIAAALDELDARSDLVAGVLTGAGSSFCTGMDLKAFLAGERPSVPAARVRRHRGAAAGQAADRGGRGLRGRGRLRDRAGVRSASWPRRDAPFGLPEVRRGLVAAGGGLLRLPDTGAVRPGGRVGAHRRVRARVARAARSALSTG